MRRQALMMVRLQLRLRRTYWAGCKHGNAGSVAGEGYDASFHTKAWLDARFAEDNEPKESYEEYRVRKAKEDAKAQEKELALEEAEGAAVYHHHQTITFTCN